jgi:glyoxylase-like metal-dependent hydrolase (beta-lactamase superfamily II)
MVNVQTIIAGMLATNCYVVYDPETLEAAVIDPGGDPGAILAFVREKGLTVKTVFLTHGHFDHTLALETVRGGTGAEAVAHEAEPFDKAQPDIRVKHGDTFSVGGNVIEILHTPGHTPGSICLRTGNILFTGDTLFEDDCGRCDLPGGDYGAMLQSLRFLAALEGDYTVYPGHDVSTTLSREREHNRNMREACRGKS